MTDEIVPLSLVADDSPPTDGTLLALVRTGGEDAARRLYERYAGRLRRLAERYCNTRYDGRFDAEDVVQSVFRIFFQGVRCQSYDAPPDGEIWGLLTVIALNKVRRNIEHHRAAKRSVDRTCAMPQELWAGVMGDGDTALTFLKMVIDEQLAAYPEAHREMIRRRMEGFEIDEIAELAGRSSRTVERILLQFRIALAESG